MIPLVLFVITGRKCGYCYKKLIVQAYFIKYNTGRQYNEAIEKGKGFADE